LVYFRKVIIRRRPIPEGDPLLIGLYAEALAEIRIIRHDQIILLRRRIAVRVDDGDRGTVGREIIDEIDHRALEGFAVPVVEADGIADLYILYGREIAGYQQTLFGDRELIEIRVPGLFIDPGRE